MQGIIKSVIGHYKIESHSNDRARAGVTGCREKRGYTKWKSSDRPFIHRRS